MRLLLPYRRSALVVLVILALFVGMLGVPWLTSAASTDPVNAAWQRARAAGSYSFSGDILQRTVPSATITNVGRASRTDQLHLAGETDLRHDLLELQLWSQGGSVAQPESGVAVRVAQGKTYLRQGTGDWQESDGLIDGVAPQGDFMSFLSAVRDVTAQPAAAQDTLSALLSATRYTFTLDGEVLAAYLRNRLEETMRQQGELPPGIHLNASDYYREMTGHGELWVGEDGLPLRQVLHLQFPEQNDETISAQMTISFSRFGQPSNESAFARLGLNIVNAVADPVPWLSFVSLAAAAFVVFFFRHRRTVQHALSIALIGSLLGGPLLSHVSQISFIDTQNAKAATQEQQRTEMAHARDLAAAPADAQFDPHQNPLQSALAAGPIQPHESGLAAPLMQIGLGIDTDNDGLTDYEELSVGTDPTYADTDEDGIPDELEVRGFSLGGQDWFTDPRSLDSNRDGIGDGQEWDHNQDGLPDDTDGDGVPDLFDFDNDGDGVPDSKDLSPFTALPTVFTESSPFQLTVNNLTAGMPTFVDLQVRPQDDRLLWYAFNVLDWPLDSRGQVQDIDLKRYADLAIAEGRVPAASDWYGDMKLIPMLEIRVPNNGANLPPQQALTPYNITVNNLTANGSSKIVYVPLNLITDEATGEHVAFNARMPYLPTGNWPSPHDIRLAWVVQVLSDQPCDPKNADDLAQGCRWFANGYYIPNVPQVVQSYYDNWTLTGLAVKEDHGASIAIVYEDPAVDSNLKRDDALTALSLGLDNAFLTGRDQDNNGVRDLPINELARRFNRTTNSGVSETERWAVPNILRVEHKQYPTFDQALSATAMTETVRILNSHFASPWSADKTIKPLLMYAQEMNARTVALDELATGDGFVVHTGNALRFDLQPAGQPRMPLVVTATLKWTPYCAPATATPNWAPCELDVWWNELEARSPASVLLPGDDPANDDLAAGRVMVMNLYATALMQGIQRVVQHNNQLVSSIYTLKSDGDMETTVRAALGGGGAAVKALANQVIMARFVNQTTVLEYFGGMLKELRGGSIGDIAKKIGNIFLDFRVGGHLNRLIGTGIVLAAVAVVAGLVTILVLNFVVGNLGGQIAFKTLTIGLSLVLSVISPILTLKDWVSVSAAAGVPLRVGGLSSQVIGQTRAAAAIGTVIAVAVTWGFFVYSMVSNQVSAFSPEFNRALAETIATTIYLILLFVLSATVIGAIIVGIIAVIDSILTAICELGVDELRTVPGLGGACFTLGNATIKLLAYLIYNYDPMVNLTRDDLVVTGAPQLAFANPNRGFVVGNPFSITLPITTTVVHKDPDPANGLMIYPYMWLFSAENIRTSTFEYSLTQPNKQTITVERNQMNNKWSVNEDRKYLVSPMYRAQANTTPQPLAGLALPAGLNRTVPPFYINMGYAVPAYECWGLAILGVCYTRDLAGEHSIQLDPLTFDVFPATLADFVALVDKGNGGYGLAWDTRFAHLYDADGDGLRSKVRNGLDPDDTTWDADGDGLADAFELERRQAGVAFSPEVCDTDGDGLTDRQEAYFGTDPANSDSDRDGLLDREEVWHQVYDTVTCQPTNSWAGGWLVTIDDPIGPAGAITVRVSSNPLVADSDQDGISDFAERALAQDPNPALRLDQNGYPYHPNVLNVPPVSIYTAINDLDGLVAPGQSFVYSTTVVAHVALNPSPLDVLLPAPLGGSTLNYTLPFDPLTFSTAQTITQPSMVSVLPAAASQTAQITSRVTANLPAGGTFIVEGDLAVVIDGDPPSSTIDSLQDGQYLQAGPESAPVTIIIGGSATDAGSGIRQVEVSVNGGPWQLATGTASWTFPLDLVEIPFTINSGSYTIQTRATDGVGNVETPGAGITIRGDATAPDHQYLGVPSPIIPLRTPTGQWSVPLRFNARDLDIGAGALPGSGIVAGSVEARLRDDKVTLDPDDDVVVGNGWQTAVQESGNLQLGVWNVNFLFPLGQADPTGRYNLDVRAVDEVGNRGRDSNGITVLVLDASAPLATLNASDANRHIFTGTLTIGGQITDVNSLIGIDSLEASFVPIDQVVPMADASLHLPFDEPANAVYFADQSGQAHDASCTVGVGMTCPLAAEAGRVDRALRFVGGALENSLVVNDPATFNIPADQDFTLQVWIKSTQAARTVLQKNSAYSLRLAADGRVEWNLMGGAPISVIGGPSLIDDQWHQVVAVVDRATSTARLYVDGLPVASQPIGNVAFTSADPLAIGGPEGSAEHFAGVLDDLLISPRALTESEVAALAQYTARPWVPATLAQRGTGVATSTWALAVPAGLEGQYQLDLRTADMLGNRRVLPNHWRGIIDTVAPRVVLSATETTASYFDPALNGRRYGVAYTCAAQDQHLDETSFECPGEQLPPPTRSFDQSSILQRLFPDLTIRNGLAITYTQWEATTQINKTASACDEYGNCASATAQLTLNVPTGSEPMAVVASPSDHSVVASAGTVNVEVVAEAAQSLREVTLSLNGVVVETLSFAESAAVKQHQQLLVVTPPGEGQHVLVAQATDWDGGVQTTLYPISFTLDTQPPVATIEPATLTLSDTWQIGSGYLRFKGTASDTVCLASVKLSVDDGPLTDVRFANGLWQTAQWVNAPEGRTLTLRLVATDCAGRVTETIEEIATELSSPTAPGTTITAGPAAVTVATTASFSFVSIPGGNEMAGFACQLDDGLYQPCSSPQTYTGLSGGQHHFRVRAIDSQGFVDITPASQSWTVDAAALDITNLVGPTTSTPNREATFTWQGNAGLVAYECALDGAAFAACKSPATYRGLANGAHTFRVRGRDAAGNYGPTFSQQWTVVNQAPVAADQSLTTVAGKPLAITLTASDPNGDPLTFSVITAPAHGTLSGTAPNLTYTAVASFAGQDSLRFRVTDGFGGSAEGTITITVTKADGPTPTPSPTPVTPGNRPPVARDDTAQTRVNTAVTVNVLANDGDPDGDTLTVTIITAPNHGSAMVNNGRIVYTPEQGFVGTDELVYGVDDGRGGSATAKVTITVTEEPISEDQSLYLPLIQR